VETVMIIDGRMADSDGGGADLIRNCTEDRR
jgi:hypothetical protein